MLWSENFLLICNAETKKSANWNQAVRQSAGECRRTEPWNNVTMTYGTKTSESYEKTIDEAVAEDAEDLAEIAANLTKTQVK